MANEWLLREDRRAGGRAPFGRSEVEDINPTPSRCANIRSSTARVMAHLGRIGGDV